jgi:hypothetical protein
MLALHVKKTFKVARSSFYLKQVAGVVEESLVKCCSSGLDHGSIRTANVMTLKVNGKKYYLDLNQIIRIDAGEEVILHLSEEKNNGRAVAIQILKNEQVVFRAIQLNDRFSEYSFEQ